MTDPGTRGACSASVRAQGDRILVQLPGRFDPAVERRVCDAVHALLLQDALTTIVCSVDGAPDLGVVSALARLQLLGRRNGVTVQLGSAAGALDDLLALTGLQGALPARSEPVGQPEAREEGGVEEVVDVGDGPV